jgi:uncharacterized protein
MSAGRVDAVCVSHNLDLLVALEIVVPVLLNRVRVRDKPAVSVGVDIGTPGALGELAGVVGLLRSGLLSATENVARVYAEQECNDQNDQSGATADCDLPATSSSSTAHLRRVELGTLVVFHVCSTASKQDARPDRQENRGVRRDTCQMPCCQLQPVARMRVFTKSSYPLLRPATATHHHQRTQRGSVASGTVGDMSVTVDDNSMDSRYEARIDGVLVGASQYELTPDTIVFLHTVVRQEYEGRGVGSAIARFALDDARARGLRVRPLCPYIRGWLDRHPEYGDLISTTA